MKRLLVLAIVAACLACTQEPEISVVRAEDALVQRGPVPLSATLIKPGDDGVYPAVIFVQGRNYGSREQFRHHARQFAAKGIVGLVFDGRGHGNSGGDPLSTTAEDRYADVQAVIEFAVRHREIDPERIALFGHSAGGWIVPVVAERDSRVKALILHAGPAVPLNVQQGQVVAALMRRSDDAYTEEEIKAAQSYQELLVHYAMREATFDSIERFVATIENERWKDRVDRPQSDGDSELSFFRRQPYDASGALARLQIPILALYGGDDYVVDAESNGNALQDAARAAGNEAVSIHTFPAADHSLKIDELRHPEGYWPTLLGWSMKTLGEPQTVQK